VNSRFFARVARVPLFLLCTAIAPAHAALGGQAETIDGDSATMHAIGHASRMQGPYTVHTIALPSGTVVREYVAPSGLVFGVAWDGPTLPDLKATLGNAFDRYVGAAAAGRKAALAVSASDLVVYSSGHLRAFAGHAYLPQALPSGVDASVVQ
jgi:hypothetical protein